MKILLTNDDGYAAKGIKELARIMKNFGEVTAVAPKKPQSGMSMAVTMGGKALAYKNLGIIDDVRWAYLDATPASCVKLALNTVFSRTKPDVVISGVNHGTNAASAVCYSGTLGAAAEAALCGIPAIGVSLHTCDPDADFSSVEKYFPDIFRKIMENLPDRYGIYYNINFPKDTCPRIKGVRTAVQGMGRWTKEFLPWRKDGIPELGISPEQAREALEKAEENEELYVITGNFTDDPQNTSDADHRLNADGYITVVPHNIDCTDYKEVERIKSLKFDIDY